MGTSLPPPPPDIAALQEDNIGVDASLRQRLEQHRANESVEVASGDEAVLRRFNRRVSHGVPGSGESTTLHRQQRGDFQESDASEDGIARPA